MKPSRLTLGARIVLEEPVRALRSIVCRRDDGEQRQGTENRMRKTSDREYSVGATVVN